MRYVPMFLDLRGRRVLLAGGGEAMAQKARLLARTEAALTVLAPRLHPELAALVAAGRAGHVPATYAEAEVDAADLVFAATGCTGIDALVSERARARGAIVNVVDRPRLCTALTPAIVDRAPVVVAIGTEGAAPVLAREIRLRLEAMLEPSLGGLAALAGRLRPEVEDRVPREGRRRFWEGIFGGRARRLWREGRAAEAEAEIRRAARAGGAAVRGAVDLIAQPAAPDLLTLRAAARLEAADLVLHPEGSAVPDLVRRDAGRAAWGREAEAAARAAAAAAAGARVALLVPPGRAAALARRLAALGAETEILPAPGRASSRPQEAGMT